MFWILRLVHCAIRGEGVLSDPLQDGFLAVVDHDVERAINLIEQVKINHLVCVAAIRAISGSEALIPNLQAAISQSFFFDPAKKSQAELIEHRVAQARSLVASDFYILRNCTLVALCSALEGFISTVLCERLPKKIEKMKILAHKKVRIDVANLIHIEPTVRVTAAVNALFEDVKASTKGKGNQFKLVFDEIGDQFDFEDEIVEGVNQAFDRRNRIVHASGAVDVRSRGKGLASDPINEAISQQDLRAAIKSIEGFAYKIYDLGGYSPL